MTIPLDSGDEAEHYMDEPKFPSFRDWILGGTTSKWFFHREGSFVFSLTIFVDNLGNGLFKISGITWQEEDLTGMSALHNVCHSSVNDFALYDSNTDTFTQDLWLKDKYGDGSDGYLSSKLDSFFIEVPN